MSEKNVIQAKGRPMLFWEGKTASLHLDYYPAQEVEVYGNTTNIEFNKIFWGDNFQVLSHLLKEYRGKINLIYIDPPFDSKADYVRKIKFRGKKYDGKEQNYFEEKQYTDIWGKDEYLQFMYERLLLLRELLDENGTIYLHCDWHKVHHLRCIMDEVFGEDNFRNEVIWSYFVSGKYPAYFAKDHDNILVYAKTDNPKFNYSKFFDRILYLEKKEEGNLIIDDGGNPCYVYNGENRTFEKQLGETWDINKVKRDGLEKTGYPTQKPEELLERIIKAASDEGDIILDCFMGSGTTCAVAQKLGRRWIGCDINTGSINTTIKRLNKILVEQKKQGLNSETPLAFKVYNVNEYNLFKNKEEGIQIYKQIVLDKYGVSFRRGFFDGETTSSLVKIVDPNRILSKKDIDEVVKNIDVSSDDFIYSRSPLKYKKIEVICSGKELDSEDYIVRLKKSGKLDKDINFVVKDLLIEQEGLIFKEKPYLEYNLHNEKDEVILEIADFISPVLLQKLSIENKGVVEKTIIEDRKQIIDSVAVDVNYDGKLFNAEIIDVPEKNKLVTGKYILGKIKGNTIALKVIDVLGEELFLTIDT